MKAAEVVEDLRLLLLIADPMEIVKVLLEAGHSLSQRPAAALQGTEGEAGPGHLGRLRRIKALPERNRVPQGVSCLADPYVKGSQPLPGLGLSFLPVQRVPEPERLLEVPSRFGQLA